MKIGFVGLGKLGLPCAEVIAKKGYDVSGVDIDNKIHSTIVTLEKDLYTMASDRDIIFVAVPTPHKEKYDGSFPTSHLPSCDFDYSIVKDVLNRLNKIMTKNQLLVLISTVLPGTTRREFINLVTNTRFVYNPFLIAMGSVSWDFVNPEIVMIGTEDGKTSGDAALLVDFYKSIMENDPEYIVGTWDECECIKVFYNTFISTKIAFVNMIQDVAVKQGNINANFVASSLTKCHQRLISDKYMKPGMGDGGSCHPRDNTALRYLSDSLNLGYDMFGHIMFVREKQAENMAKEILKMSKIVHFSSDSFKDGVTSTDGSYSLLVQHFILKHGGSLVNSRDCEVFVKVHESDVVPDNKMVFDVWKDYGNKY